MKYKHANADTDIARLFSYDIDVPDELGTVLHSHKHGTTIIVVCEHGTHWHKTTKRDPRVMMNKGIRAKVMHITKPVSAT